jgi:hypothetical protein
MSGLSTVPLHVAPQQSVVHSPWRQQATLLARGTRNMPRLRPPALGNSSRQRGRFGALAAVKPGCRLVALRTCARRRQLLPLLQASKLGWLAAAAVQGPVSKTAGRLKHTC